METDSRLVEYLIVLTAATAGLASPIIDPEFRMLETQATEYDLLISIKDNQHTVSLLVLRAWHQKLTRGGRGPKVGLTYKNIFLAYSLNRSACIPCPCWC